MLRFRKMCQATGFSRALFFKGIFKNELYLASCLKDNFLYIMSQNDMSGKCLLHVMLEARSEWSQSLESVLKAKKLSIEGD